MMGSQTASAQGAASVSVGRDVKAPITTSYIGTKIDTQIQMFGVSPVPVAVAVKDPRVIFTDAGIDTFTGRKWLADELDRFIAVNSRGYVFVEADAGMGKTAFAAWLVKTRGYLSHFSRYSGGGTARAALQNLSAQLIKEFSLGDQAPGGLLPEWAQTPGGFESLLSMAAARTGERKSLVVVVDGLDEAEPPGDGLPFGLPSLLPDGAYVIATYRSGLSLAQPDAPTLHLRIDENSQQNRDDISVFLAKAVRKDELAKQLAEVGLDAASFVSLLADRCGGVWVYLRYVLDELRIGLRRPDEITDLPPGLQRYYADQIRRWQHDSAWDNGLLPLVATLGVVGEPLPATALARLAGNLDPSAVRRWCNFTLRPLLATTRAATGGIPLRYEIYHASFRDALNGSWPAGPDDERADLAALADELGQAAIMAHARIAETYLSCFGGLNAGLPTLADDLAAADVDDGYPLRHLARHLQYANRGAELHRLLAVEYPVGDGRVFNVWFAAHDHSDCILSYLDDLARARADSAAATDHALACHQPAATLGSEIRYGLMAASIVSRTVTIPVGLLEQVIRAGLWSPGRALDHTRRLADLPSRVEALIAVHRHVNADQQHGVLAEALTAATAITGNRDRAKALTGLAPLLPADQQHGVLAQALTAATAITDNRDRAKALTGLAPLLPADQQHGVLAQALAAATAAANHFLAIFWRADALTALVPHLPLDLLAQALTAATAITDEGSRAAVLAALAPHLPSDLLAQAPDIAAAITDDSFRAEALSALAPQVPAQRRPDVLTQALATATAITDDGSRAMALAKLAPHLPRELLDQVLTAATAIPNDFLRSWTLATLVPLLSSGERPSVLAQALTSATAADDTSGGSVRTSWLTWLAPLLPPNLRPGGLTQALYGARAQALTRLIPLLTADEQPAVLAQALDAATAIPNAYSRAEALTSLASVLPADEQPAVLAQALDAATAIPEAYSCAQALTSLASVLPADERPGVLAQALDAVNAMSNGYDRTLYSAVLAGMARYLSPELVAQALDAVTAISDDYSRADALAGLAILLPASERPSVLAQALDAATAISDDFDRVRVLACLASHLPPELLGRALATATAITDDHCRAMALTYLAPHLPTPLLAQAVDVATAIRSNYSRAEALTDLASLLPVGDRSGVLAQALDAATNIRDVKALTRLALLFQGDERHGVLAKALDAAAIISNGYSRSEALANLAPHLPPDLVVQALSDAAAMTEARGDTLASLARHLPSELLPQVLPAISDDRDRAQALTALAPHVPADERPGVLSQALAAAVGIADENARAHALTSLAPHLSPELMTQALTDASAITDENARSKALASLAPHLPSELLPEVLPAISQDRDRAQALTALAPHVPADERPGVLSQALAAAAGIADENARAHALISLAPHLSPELMTQALTDASAITDEHDRAIALTRMALHVSADDRPDALAQALDAVAAITSESARELELQSLAPNLSAELMPRALAAATAITENGDRAKALGYLAPHLPPELLAEALAATPRDWSSTLTAVLARIRSVPTQNGDTAWVELMRNGLDGTRRDVCLKVISVVAATTNEIGGTGAIQECVKSVADVHRWWP
jgi:hypothetical protein